MLRTHCVSLLVNNKTAECEEGVTSYRGRVKYGEAKAKLGLIAERGLTEHLSPPLFAFR